ncbi:MAG: cyanophycinase, partial [Burkholderiales bacterium]|nr:cyanophycinase [Burkholderiales bacterium]
NRSGFVIPIGGAEDKSTDSKVLDKFVQLCGGREARIAIIPTASELSDTGDRYVEVFEKLGVKEAHNLKIKDSRDAERASYIKMLKEATGVFITGGNQRRLVKILDDTEVEEIIKERNQNDQLHVAGTSAGAVYVCKYMLASGGSGLLPGEEMATLGEGLGLLKNVIVDQHFSQRDRLGRLLTVLSTSPSEVQVGLGIDEDTAAFIGPDECLEVVGNGRITIVDVSNVKYAAVNQEHDDKIIDLAGIVMHVLSEGNKYKIKTKEVIPVGESNLDIIQ